MYHRDTLQKDGLANIEVPEQNIERFITTSLILLYVHVSKGVNQICTILLSPSSVRLDDTNSDRQFLDDQMRRKIIVLGFANDVADTLQKNF